MDIFATFFVSLAFLRIFSLLWNVLVITPLLLSSRNTRAIYRINVVCNYLLPIIWVAILIALLIFPNIFAFISNEFALIISATFLIPYLFYVAYGIYIGLNDQNGQSSPTVDRLLNSIFVPFFYVPLRAYGSFVMLIMSIMKKKILISSDLGNNPKLIPLPPAGKEFDRFFIGLNKKMEKITRRIESPNLISASRRVESLNRIIIPVASYVPLILTSYLFLKEEGLPINSVTLFGIFMVMLGLVNVILYSKYPIRKRKSELSIEGGSRATNPLLIPSVFIGLFLITALFVWARFFQLGLTLTYTVLFGGLTLLSVYAREKISIKGNTSLRLIEESSGLDFQTYAPTQMISGSLTMALVVYPLLKSYEVYGALKASTPISAEILTIAIGGFYASLISLSIMIMIARNMIDPEYQGSRDSLARNSLLYLYVFITLTYFGTSLIGITPSSIIAHNYNPNLFNIGVIFASGAILYVGFIEVPYRLGAQKDRNRKLQEQTKRLKDLEQQFDNIFSEKLDSDFTALFYQREWLKSRIDELNKTPISLFKKIPLPATVAALLSGILMEIAVPRLTEAIKGMLGS